MQLADRRLAPPLLTQPWGYSAEKVRETGRNNSPESAIRRKEDYSLSLALTQTHTHTFILSYFILSLFL